MFNAHDRCDQCGAQARARVTKPVIPESLEELEFSAPRVHELLFCWHHMQGNARALAEQGFSIVETQEPEPA